jgi:S-adenosylmethionine/arginine decarboxylase-like enzyme
MNTWGVEVMLDCYACDKSKITDKTNIENFARELVERIDMVAYGDPQVVLFGSGNKQGYTLVQLIETSNIVAHFCDESGDAYLNVFSCKNFNGQDVAQVFEKYFSPTHYKITRIPRNAGPNNVE